MTAFNDDMHRSSAPCVCLLNKRGILLMQPLHDVQMASVSDKMYRGFIIVARFLHEGGVPLIQSVYQLEIALSSGFMHNYSTNSPRI